MDSESQWFGYPESTAVGVCDGPVARLLKFLVLVLAGVAIVHKLQPMFGVELF